MNSLFAKNSLMILESLSFTKTLYAFDFDGTLSKIVSAPTEANMTQTTSDLLQELSKLVPVAIVSGRSVKDLKCRLSFRPKYLVGNHGLEGLSNSLSKLDQAKKVCRAWKSKLQKSELGAGVEIEDKSFSLATHYRRSRSKKESKLLIRNAVATLVPAPRVISGKAVTNLLPLGAPHKGVAVLEMMKTLGVSHAFYIGDDDTDEDVFSLPDSQIMTVRVGKKKSSHARYFTEKQSDINRLLKLLIRYHTANQK